MLCTEKVLSIRMIRALNLRKILRVAQRSLAVCSWGQVGVGFSAVQRSKSDRAVERGEHGAVE